MGTFHRTVLLVAALCLALCSFSASAQTTPAITPFPGTSACQRCANDPKQCGDAFKGLPGKYCGPWLSGGVKQACCCPPAARCVIPINAASCGCDSDPTPISKPSSSSGTPFWVWILVGVGVLALTVVIWRCCCGTVYEAEPVYVPSGGVAYVSQPPMVVQQPYGYNGGYGGGYGYGGGGNMAAGVAIGATAGIVGGVLIGEALADGHHNHGDYGGNYGGGGGDYGGGGGGGGGADFGGDF